MRAARTILTGFVVLFTLVVISGCGGAPEISGQWKGNMEIDGDPAGLEISLNITERQGDSRNVRGSGTVTFVEGGTEQSHPLNITSGKMGRGGNLNFTTGENSRFSPMTFQGSAGPSRIQGNVVIDSEEVSGGPFELARGENGERLLTGTIERAKEERQQQQAATDLEELDSRLGSLLYGNGGGSSEPQSVEAAIETVEGNATTLRDKLKSTFKEDMEERESENEDVQEILQDYRAGETSTEEACFDIRYDRADFSQLNGISDSSVEEYRQARDTLKQSKQKLDELLDRAKDTLKKLEAARKEAPDDAPPPSYGEGDLKRLEKKVKEAHEKADSALKETKSKRKEYGKRAQKASDRALAAFDEIGIKNDISCFDLSPDETTAGQTRDEPSSGTGGATSSSDNDEDSGASSLQSFISEYYEAVGAEDWEATYSMLDSRSQSVYTQSEWGTLQDARERVIPLPPVSSVEISNVTRNGDGSVQVEVVLNPGTNNEASTFTNVSLEDGEYHRHLTRRDVSYLNGLRS
jgi:uncharacterized lipoprotein YehR (DUF1307 family)